MEIPLKLKEDKKYLEAIRILANLKNPEIKPYNKLRNREMEVLAVLYYMYNERHKNVSEKERNILIFSYESRQEIADRLSDEETSVSKDTVYNIMMDLRKKGFIDKKSMIKSMVLPNINKLTLKFI